ncbi:MAG: PadR family transcriptional regulator [Oscillospiraceae bacterium]|nr:PadR family transcriptional regulator [Oscillospiraceae bacterium]
MAAIDLIVLGMLKREPLSAYDMQKLVEYRNISKWVRISTPSIYKKVLQLEEKGLVWSTAVRESNMPEKAVYRLTDAGQQEFQRLMLELSGRPVRFFLDFNAVMVNLDSLPPEGQAACLEGIAKSVGDLKALLKENLREKADVPQVPPAGLAVLRQQLALADAVEAWLDSLQTGGPLADGTPAPACEETEQTE